MWPSSQDVTLHAAGLGSLRGSMEGALPVVYDVHRLRVARAQPRCSQPTFVHSSPGHLRAAPTGLRSCLLSL